MIVRGLLQRACGLACNLRFVTAQLVEEHRRLQHEHAAIPGTRTNASGEVFMASCAATAMAGAVSRPSGSSTIEAGVTPAWRICSATRKRCSWLVMTIGAAIPSMPRRRSAVC
jgi:hypothetical protein